MSRKHIGLLILVIFLAAIQLLQPARNENGQVSAFDIRKIYFMPDTIHMLLQNSCYDCHSNHTSYPWYSKIQPLGWWLAGHIKKGKAELNFSEFGNYSQRRQKSKLKAIKDALEDHSMPLSSYTVIHAKARLSKENEVLIVNWINQIQDSLQRN